MEFQSVDFMRFITRNRIRIHTWLIGLLCGLMSSCLEDINLDTGEQILNVYCVLKDGLEQELELSFISPTGGTSCPVGDNSTIMLYDGDTPVGEFTKASETKWSLDYKPQGGHTYWLEVRVPGEETLTAETTFPPVFALQEVYLRTLVKQEDGSYANAYYRMFELNAEEDQILWCCFENRNEGDVMADYVTTDHPGLDARGESMIPFDYSSGLWAHDFYRSAGGFYSEGRPFLHERVLRILHPAGFCWSNELIDKFYFDKDFQNIAHEKGIADVFGLIGVNKSLMLADLVIYSVSSEYDAYLADYYYGRYDSDDFAVTIYRRNHYSNIQNGTGIFGAFREYRKERIDIEWNLQKFLW